ncbi:MAG: HAMP domain-containing protein [Clostridiales bacterium]|nr:HAMP domain-containing protein [Clostridiales bacterium]
MNRSFVLKRILTVVAASLAMATMLIAVIYATIAPGKMAEAKVKELLPRAYAAADLMHMYIMESKYISDYDQNYAFKTIGDLLINEQSILNSYMYAYVKDTNEIIFTRSAQTMDSPSEQTLNLLAPYRDSVYNGMVVSTAVDLMDGRGNCLLVGVPITAEGSIIGAVFLTKTLEEVNAAFQSLNTTLFISLITVFCMMLILSYFASLSISRPILQMREVALAIAGEDYSARANETARGEIGELGRTLNYLAAQLSDSIGAIILERNRLLQLLDGLNEGILALDVNGAITHANPALYTLMGLPADASINALTNTPALRSAIADVDIVTGTKSTAVKQVASGERMLRVILSPMVGSKGDCEGAVVLFSDISESEQLEKTRREYVANVSHELRTPVSSLIGLAETLNDGIITNEEDRQRYYGLILKESQRLSRLIDDLLELSRLQEGRAQADIRKEDLYDVVRDSLEPLMPLAEEKGVGIILHQSLAACPPALTDSDRMEQVLVILTDNALRFTPSGGKIEYSAKWDESTIYITVTDTGCGIPRESLARVFDRFYKEDTSYASPGTGLGLSIAQKALGLMGQRIWVESEVGKGAAFTFTVRRAL